MVYNSEMTERPQIAALKPADRWMSRMTVQTPVGEEQLVREIREMPSEYWPNLLEIIHLVPESVTLKPAQASFRQGWQESRKGQARPVSELWDGIDAQ